MAEIIVTFTRACKLLVSMAYNFGDSSFGVVNICTVTGCDRLGTGRVKVMAQGHIL